MSQKVGYVLLFVILLGAIAWAGVTYNDLMNTRLDLHDLQTQILILEMHRQDAEDRRAEAEEKLSSAELTISSLESKLELYEDTWGSVSSDVQLPFQGADIINYGTASNPTWARLLDFLLSDRTDQKAYVPGIYMCGDFARDLHNNAERAGIRAAYVAVDLPGGYHALNAFKTADRGLVFIDCTGLEASESGPSNCDKTVDVRLGKRYVPKSLFPESGWSVTWENMGTVRDVEIYW